jgi:predicted RNA polymerase sigma factor
VVVRVNWAVAAMHASGADAGLMLIRQVDESVVERWHLYWVTRAEIEHRAGMVEDGLRSLDRALACDMNDAERTLLSRRRAERSR